MGFSTGLRFCVLVGCCCARVRRVHPTELRWHPIDRQSEPFQNSGLGDRKIYGFGSVAMLAKATVSLFPPLFAALGASCSDRLMRIRYLTIRRGHELSHIHDKPMAVEYLHLAADVSTMLLAS